jgi:hypothetical protein
MNEYLDGYKGKKELEVIAQYDPNGLKPRVLEMPVHAVGTKPGEEDGNLDTTAGDEISLAATFEAVRDDLKGTSGEQASDLAAPAPVTDDLVACRFADLSTEAMLRSFIRDHLDGDSRQHMLVLSGHGAGVSGDFLTDEDPHSSLMISRLGEILTEACSKKKSSEEKKSSKEKKIDILGIDSCLMGMAEVACEVKDHVSFLVGSEGFVNNTGWPYHRVLSVLAGPGDPKDAAESIVEKYAAFYQDYEMAGSSTQIAALDLGKLSNLTAAVETLAQALKSALEPIAENSEQKELEEKNSEREEVKQTSPRTVATDVRDAVILAHWYAQSFKWGEYADLWDFCDQLRRFLPNGKFEEEKAVEYVQRIEDAIKRVKKAVDGVVIRSCYCGPEFQHAHGVAIYFPWSALAVPPSYEKLKFAKETHWDKFLDVYLKTTRRMLRGATRCQLGDKPQDPRRFGPDVKEVENLPGVLGAKTGTHSNVRSGTHSNVRSGSPYGTRMLGGTLIVPANFQNVPDGYLRQDLNNPRLFTGAKQKGLGAAASK